MLRLVQHRYRTELESTIASLLQFRINGRDGISLNRPLYRWIFILFPLDERPDLDGYFNAVRHREWVTNSDNFNWEKKWILLPHSNSTHTQNNHNIAIVGGKLNARCVSFKFKSRVTAHASIAASRLASERSNRFTRTRVTFTDNAIRTMTINLQISNNGRKLKHLWKIMKYGTAILLSAINAIAKYHDILPTCILKFIQLK